jgi:hypothetical protein
MTVSIIFPNGGTGSPYKWRAVPSTNTFNPNDSAIKNVGQSYDFSTIIGTTNVFYDIYLIDNQGNEKKIITTTTTCIVAPVGNLILTVEPAISNPDIVGSHSFGSNTISRLPQRTIDFIVTLTNSAGSPITAEQLNSISFNLTKDVTNTNIMDINYQFGPLNVNDNTLHKFNTGTVTTNSNNSFYKKTIKLEITNISQQLTKPSGAISASPELAQLFVKLVNINTGTYTVSQPNKTLTINASTWQWN